MFTSLFVVMLGLWVVCSTESTNVSSLGLPRLSGPSEALVKTVVELNCELLIYPDDEPILLQLFKQGDRDKILSEYTSLNGEVASFPMFIKHYHEGDLECEAKAQNNSNIEPTVSNVHHLRVVEPVKGAEIDVSLDAVEFFEGTALELHCRITAGNHVSYNWLLNGQRVSQGHLNNDHLWINRTTSEDSGSYTCEAKNHFSNTKYFTSTSAAVVITVKDVVSDPDISFSLLKDATHNYSAVVTCQSTKGTPPVFFSLHNRTHLVANTTAGETTAKFKVPLHKHLQWLHCQANNGNHTVYSKWIPLKFVPVGGPVVMHYHYDVGENYAVTSLTFYCKVAKGSLPRYQWFLNKTLLPERGTFHYVVDQPPEQSMLVLSVEKRSAGTYHCEVSDSFDNTTAVNSEGWYVDEEVLNRMPVAVVAVVIGSFTVLVLLVCSCCWIGVLLRQRQYGETSPVGLEMERMETTYDAELDFSDYGEDAAVARAARGDAFDQASEASVDEWPQIEKEKETLEDEAEEF